jgi:hypothetical protein
VAVVLGDVLAGFVAMLVRVRCVTVRDLRMMTGLFVGTRFVMLGSFAMMIGGMLMMHRRSLVMFGALMRGHSSLPVPSRRPGAAR